MAMDLHIHKGKRVVLTEPAAKYKCPRQASHGQLTNPPEDEMRCAINHLYFWGLHRIAEPHTITELFLLWTNEKQMII